MPIFDTPRAKQQASSCYAWQRELDFGQSIVYQLIEITHIFSTFDCSPTLETRAVFLDVSKAFDKAWHKGLLYKLEWVFQAIWNLMESFLSERYQRVFINGQSSK